MREKRKTPRVSEENGIAVRAVPEGTDDSSSPTFLRLTKDISETGLRFSNADGIAEDTDIQIHLALDLPRKIVTRLGKVRWARQLAPDEPYSVGVEFTDSSPVDMGLWTHYIETRMSSAS